MAGESGPCWPQHKGALHITHNDHKSVHETVGEALESGTYWREGFPDEAEIQKAIQMDSVWEIQWYPETPVGFYRVFAATFERALEYAHTAEESAKRLRAQEEERLWR